MVLGFVIVLRVMMVGMSWFIGVNTRILTFLNPPLFVLLLSSHSLLILLLLCHSLFPLTISMCLLLMLTMIAPGMISLLIDQNNQILKLQLHQPYDLILSLYLLF